MIRIIVAQNEDLDKDKDKKKFDPKENNLNSENIQKEEKIEYKPIQDVIEPENIDSSNNYNPLEDNIFDEDLELIGEEIGTPIIPSVEQIETPPKGLSDIETPSWVPMPSVTPKGQDPNAPYFEMMDFTFLPFGEDPQNVEPVDPSELFDEVSSPMSSFDEMNRNLDIREKIWESMNRTIPLRIQYQTLPDKYGSSSLTDRIIQPDYVYWSDDTRRHVLVAWCHLRNDWRAFAVDNIKRAEITS